MSKDDYVIVCGDFGIWEYSAKEANWLNWLDDKPFTTLFVTGNHSNYDILKEHPIELWNGGKVQKIRKSVIHLMRGQVFDIDGYRFFTMGGASSHDIDDGILDRDDPLFLVKKRELDKRLGMYRINHVSWWEEELPNDAEYQEAEANVEQTGWNVDYIITHCCPTSIVDIIGDGLYQHDRLTDFFETLAKRCQFKHWYFGHYHDEQNIQERYHLLYEAVAPLDIRKSG